MSLTKLYLVGNNKIFPGQGGFGYSDIPAGDGDGKMANLFLQCNITQCSIHTYQRSNDSNAKNKKQAVALTEGHRI